MNLLYISYHLYRGFYYLKKLFNTNSLIAIDDFSSLRINGPYELLSLGPDFATIKSGNYKIGATGENLKVEVLSEEVAVFSFSTITNMTVMTIQQEEKTYGS